MSKVIQRASLGGAAAKLRLSFKVPSQQIPTTYKILSFIPATELVACMRSADGTFNAITLPSANCLGDNPTAENICELIDAEVSGLYDFVPDKIYIEWPARTKNQTYKNAALLAFRGVKLWAQSIGRNVECVAPEAIGAAFGARKANLEAIEGAVRDSGVGWEVESTSQRETLAIALLHTVLARGVAA